MATADFKPMNVKDVPANEFIAAYAAHLKSTDKVRAAAALS
jgi:ribosomal protein S19E (S16A)